MLNFVDTCNIWVMNAEYEFDLCLDSKSGGSMVLMSITVHVCILKDFWKLKVLYSMLMSMGIGEDAKVIKVDIQFTYENDL